MKPRTFGVAAMAIIAIATFGAERRVALAQESEDEASTVPMTCPYAISPSGYFQGHWFNSVSMVRRANPGGGNIANYDNLNDPTSAGKHWIWDGGGGTFSCWQQWIIPYVLDIQYQVLIPPSWGVMLPAPPSDEVAAPPPSSGSGGSGREWEPGLSPPPAGSPKTVCWVTDWYQNGVYTDTEIDYCWQE